MTAELAPLLVVEHEESCPPGWMGQWWQDGGLTLDIRRPYREAGSAGGELPADLSHHSGLVVLGGEMGANDDLDHHWIGPTKQLVRSALEERVPVLGICLGHQVIAAAMGGVVGPNPHGHATGLTPVTLTAGGRSDALLGSRRPGGAHPRDEHSRERSRLAVQWNNDVVLQLPRGAIALATSPDGTVQAARFAGRVWGVQFHPETTPDIFDSWTVDKESAAIPRADGIDVFEAARGVRAAEADLQRWWRPLADRFAAVVRMASDD